MATTGHLDRARCTLPIGAPLFLSATAAAVPLHQRTGACRALPPGGPVFANNVSNVAAILVPAIKSAPISLLVTHPGAGCAWCAMCTALQASHCCLRRASDCPFLGHVLRHQQLPQARCPGAFSPPLCQLHQASPPPFWVRHGDNDQSLPVAWGASSTTCAPVA